MASLLPPSLTDDPRAFAFDAMSQRWDAFDLSALAVYLVEQVPAAALPILATQFGVMGDYGWRYAGTEMERRRLVKDAIRNKRTMGTPSAVRRGLSWLGFPDAELWEHWQSMALRRTDGGIWTATNSSTAPSY